MNKFKMKSLYTIFSVAFSFNLLLGQAVIPESSDIFKTVGVWSSAQSVSECDPDSTKIISNIYLVKNNVVMRILFESGTPPLVDIDSKKLLPSDQYLTGKYSYTTFLKEYSLFISRDFFTHNTYNIRLSKYLNDICYSCSDYQEPWGSYKYTKNFASEPLKIDCSKTLIKLDEMVYSEKLRDNRERHLRYKRIDLKFNDAMISEMEKQALFYDSVKKEIPMLKTYADLNDYFIKLTLGSPLFLIKEKILLTSDLVNKLTGIWSYRVKNNGLEYKFETVNKFNNVLIFLSDAIDAKCELFPSEILSNSFEIDPNQIRRKLLNLAKFKIPYQYLSYDLFNKEISLSRGYEYLIEKDANYFYLRDHSNYELKSISNNELIFEGKRLFKNSDNHIKHEIVQLKWIINAEFDKIEEYINSSSGWVHYGTVQKDR